VGRFRVSPFQPAVYSRSIDWPLRYCSIVMGHLTVK
jgi:hypothetical protein